LVQKCSENFRLRHSSHTNHKCILSIPDMVRRVTQAGLQPHPAQWIHGDVSPKVSHQAVSAGGQNRKNSGEKVSENWIWCLFILIDFSHFGTDAKPH
jgi:hypothetical protein